MTCAVCHSEFAGPGEIIPGGRRCSACTVRVREVIDEARALADEARLALGIEAACADKPARASREPGQLPTSPIRGGPAPEPGCWEAGGVELRGWTWRGGEWTREQVDTRYWVFVREAPCSCDHPAVVNCATQSEYDRDARLFAAHLCRDCAINDPDYLAAVADHMRRMNRGDYR